jgi:hypothetical protein
LWIKTNNIQNKITNKQTANNSQNINNSNKNINNSNKNKLNTNSEKKDDINLGDYRNNNELYLLLWILVLASLWFYFILKNKDNFIKKTELDDKNNKEEKIEKFSDNKNKKVDFEEKQKIIYPEISDSDFIKKVEKVFRQKLKQEYFIKNIDSLTFEEIQKQIWDKLDLKKIFDMINKAKYSNIITDYSKILEFIQKI